VRIEIELDGRRCQVMLRRDGDRWVAGIDGRELVVDVEDAGGGWSMLIGPAEARHHEEDVASGLSRTPQADVVSGFSRTRTSYEVAVEPGAGGQMVVHVNGAAVLLTIIDRRHRRRRQGADGGDAARPHAVVAPMPGRIVKVLVKPGETVQPRQGLVVVEAMKMENELRAPRGGTVAEVRVAEGASVEASAVLVVLA